MSAGLFKPERDFSQDADKLIPEAEQLAKVCDAVFNAVSSELTLL